MKEKFGADGQNVEAEKALLNGTYGTCGAGSRDSFWAEDLGGTIARSRCRFSAIAHG